MKLIREPLLKGERVASEIEASALLRLLDEPETLHVIDVRSQEEFAEWSIPGAFNIPVEEIDARVNEIGSGLVVVVCAAGPRAERAAQILADHQMDSSVLRGGMAAWGEVYDDVALKLGNATVVQVRRRGKGCLSYVVGGSQSCVVIDPPVEIERSIAVAKAYGWKITHVADTHLHADHVSGARLLSETTGAQLLMSHLDAYLFSHPSFENGDVITLGGDSEIQVSHIATPGHTSGSTTFVLDDTALFTGDTLFLESVGRPDLADKAEEFAGYLFDSLHKEILKRDDSILIFPAHVGQAHPFRTDELACATLGELKGRLEALSMSRHEFVAWASSQASPRPPNYEAIVEANRGGSSLSFEEITSLEAGPNRCAVSPS